MKKWKYILGLIAIAIAIAIIVTIFIVKIKITGDIVFINKSPPEKYITTCLLD